MLKLTAVVMLALAAGKAKPAKAPEGPPDPCSPEKLKLGEVEKLTPFELPKDCKPKPPAIRVIVRGKGEVKDRLTCPESVVGGVDFKKHMLIVWTKPMVPGAGMDLWDERGKKVTVVQRNKGLCPGEPKPADPQPTVLAFLMDADPQPPEFGEATCFVPAVCK